MDRVTLINPQLYSLYCHGMRIDPKVIEEILELPYESLVNDLETIIKSSIDYSEHYQSQNFSETRRSFPIHAFFLLTELRAENSLFAVLAFLSQSNEFFQYWCGKYAKEVMWEVVYVLGNNSLESLKKFLLTGMNTPVANKVIFKAVSQVALHQPWRRNEIVEWYKDVLQYLMQFTHVDYHYSFNLTGTAIAGILDFQGVELSNEVRILYDLNKVDKSVCGDMDDFITELRTEIQSDFKSKIYGIFERYDFILNDREFYSKMEDIKETDNYLRSLLIKAK